MANATKVMSQIKRFLDEKGFSYLPHEGNSLRGLVQGQAAHWQWVIRICGGDAEIVSFHAFSPVKVPVHRLSAAAEYLGRANYGLNFGNFEMDFRDGEVSYRTSIPSTASGVSTKPLGDLIYAPCSMMDRYLPGLYEVALASADPVEAILKIEMPAAAKVDMANPGDGTDGTQPVIPEIESQTAIDPVPPSSPMPPPSSRINRMFRNDN